MLRFIKFIFILLIIQWIFSEPANAQKHHVEISYTSFRPYIHFQIDFESHGYHAYDAYEASYLRGYMDGVNKSHHYSYKWDPRYWHYDAYDVGYQHGYADHKLMVRLAGYNTYKKHRFRSSHYHSPYYSVRVWLDELSLAYLYAPAHRLPYGWNRHVSPVVVDFRYTIFKKPHKGYYAHEFKRDYRKRSYLYKKQVHHTQKKKHHAHDSKFDRRHRSDSNREFKTRRFSRERQEHRTRKSNVVKRERSAVKKDPKRRTGSRVTKQKRSRSESARKSRSRSRNN